MKAEYKFIPRKKRKAHPTADRLNATSVASLVSTLLQTSAQIRETGNQNEATNVEERRRIATELLLRDPPTFLERYGTYLGDNISLFDSISDDPEIAYYMQKLSRRKITDTMRRNRRLCFLKKKPNFMSESNMRKRNERLWQHYLGSFPGDNMKPQTQPSNKLWDLLQETRSMIREQKTNPNPSKRGPWFQGGEHIRQRTEHEKKELKKKIRQKKEEEEDLSEHDSDEEDEEMQVDVIKPAQIQQAKQRQAAAHAFKEEMTRIFLSGEDRVVDYKAIDENDALGEKIRDQDLEDRYFDSEKW